MKNNKKILGMILGGLSLVSGVLGSGNTQAMSINDVRSHNHWRVGISKNTQRIIENNQHIRCGDFISYGKYTTTNCNYNILDKNLKNYKQMNNGDFITEVVANQFKMNEGRKKPIFIKNVKQGDWLNNYQISHDNHFLGNAINAYSFGEDGLALTSQTYASQEFSKPLAVIDWVEDQFGKDGHGNILQTPGHRESLLDDHNDFLSLKSGSRQRDGFERAAGLYYTEFGGLHAQNGHAYFRYNRKTTYNRVKHQKTQEMAKNVYNHINKDMRYKYKNTRTFWKTVRGVQRKYTKGWTGFEIFKNGRKNGWGINWNKLGWTVVNNLENAKKHDNYFKALNEKLWEIARKQHNPNPSYNKYNEKLD